MDSKFENNVLDNGLTRREFVAAAATTIGGMALFSLPEQAYASNRGNVRDSLGNSLDMSKPITKVVPAGIYAQTLMETLYPEALSSLAKEVSSDSEDFNEAGLSGVARLPETGTPQGNFGKSIAYEQIKGLNPDLVLQTGFGLGGATSETSEIKTGTGVQTMYLDISFGKLPEAYRTLGSVLGCSERANKLATYIEGAQTRAISAVGTDAENLRVFYGPRVSGKKVTEGVYVQVEALETLGFTPITTPYDFENKTVNFNTLKNENPDFILLDDTTFPNKFFAANGEVYEIWKDVPAIGTGRFAVAPALMHNILGSAVFAQSIGMLWMVYVLAPQGCNLDMPTEMKKFYDLFYGLKRSNSSMAALLGEEA